jgi:hypothetical protein
MPWLLYRVKSHLLYRLASSGVQRAACRFVAGPARPPHRVRAPAYRWYSASVDWCDTPCHQSQCLQRGSLRADSVRGLALHRHDYMPRGRHTKPNPHSPASPKMPATVYLGSPADDVFGSILWLAADVWLRRRWWRYAGDEHILVLLVRRPVNLLAVQCFHQSMWLNASVLPGLFQTRGECLLSCLPESIHSDLRVGGNPVFIPSHYC